MIKLTNHAYVLLKSFPHYLADAQARPDNSIVGSVMAVTCHTPREITEAAVKVALKRIEMESAGAR